MTAPAKPSRRAPRPRKRIIRTGKPARVRRTSVAALKRKLWELFSRYVKDRDGNQCFTCPARPFGQAWHAGHMIRSTKASIRYDPVNVHSQCAYCNNWLHGNEGEYTVRFIEQYGMPKLQALKQRASVTHQWKAHELEELIAALRVGGAEYEMLYAVKYGDLAP